jgi:hypothetical protein
VRGDFFSSSKEINDGVVLQIAEFTLHVDSDVRGAEQYQGPGCLSMLTNCEQPEGARFAAHAVSAAYADNRQLSIRDRKPSWWNGSSMSEGLERKSKLA